MSYCYPEELLRKFDYILQSKPFDHIRVQKGGAPQRPKKEDAETLASAVMMFGGDKSAKNISTYVRRTFGFVDVESDDEVIIDDDDGGLDYDLYGDAVSYPWEL